MKPRELLVNGLLNTEVMLDKKKLNQATGAHFNLPGHTLADLRVVGIERVFPKKNDTIRKIRETFWINKYESSTFGLNKKD